MRKVIVMVGALALLALGAVPASAHMEDFQLGARAGLDQNNDDLFYFFRYLCTAGEDFSATVRIRQGTHVTSQQGQATCNGSETFTFLPFDGTGFHLGDARASARWVFVDHNPDVVFTNSRAIRIVDCTNAC